MVLAKNSPFITRFSFKASKCIHRHRKRLNQKTPTKNPELIIDLILMAITSVFHRLPSTCTTLALPSHSAPGSLLSQYLVTCYSIVCTHSLPCPPNWPAFTTLCKTVSAFIKNISISISLYFFFRGFQLSSYVIACCLPLAIKFDIYQT